MCHLAQAMAWDLTAGRLCNHTLSPTLPQAAQKRVRGLSDDLEEAREPFVADQARGRASGVACW